MKQVMLSTLILFVFCLSSCEEDLTPDVPASLPKLERIDRLDQRTGVSSSIHYTYADGLLATIDYGNAEYRYHYTDGAVTDIELWKAGALFVRYDYERLAENKVSVSTLAFDSGEGVVISSEETTQMSDETYRSDFYSFPMGEKTLDYYIIKTINNGNVVLSESFDVDGTSRNLISTWEFNEAINPMSYVQGRNDARNQNLSAYHTFSEDGNVIVEKTMTIETNELNLPVSIETISINSQAGERRFSAYYFYE